MTRRPLDAIRQDVANRANRPYTYDTMYRLLADIPALLDAAQERDELAAQRQRTLTFDIQLLEAIGPYLGERGQSESLIECVQRLVRESRV